MRGGGLILCALRQSKMVVLAFRITESPSRQFSHVRKRGKKRVSNASKKEHGNMVYRGSSSLRKERWIRLFGLVVCLLGLKGNNNA